MRGCAGEAREAPPSPSARSLALVAVPLAAGATPVVRGHRLPCGSRGSGTPSPTRCRCRRARQPLPAPRPSPTDVGVAHSRARPRRPVPSSAASHSVVVTEQLACLVERCVAAKHGEGRHDLGPHADASAPSRSEGSAVSVLIRSRVPAHRGPSGPAFLPPALDARRPDPARRSGRAPGGAGRRRLPSAHRRGDGRNAAAPAERRAAHGVGNVDPLRARHSPAEGVDRAGRPRPPTGGEPRRPARRPDRGRGGRRARRVVPGRSGPRDVDALADRVEQEAGARE